MNYNQLIDKAIKESVAIIDLKQENQWKLEVEENGFQSYISECQQYGTKIIRTETITDVDPEQFIRLVGDMRRKKEYDSNFNQEVQLIEQPDENTFVFYTKGQSPIGLRDMLMLTRILKYQDAYISISQSIQHPQVPKLEGVQRANIIYFLWFAKKLQNGKTQIVILGNVKPETEMKEAMIKFGIKLQQEIFSQALNHLKK